MHLTMLAAAREVQTASSSTVADIVSALSSGALKGQEETPVLFYPNCSEALPGLYSSMRELPQAIMPKLCRLERILHIKRL